MRNARKLVAVLLGLALACTAASCSSESGTATPAFPDQLEGIDAGARVVALSRSVGELWILAGGQLVGVTDDAFGLEGLSADAVSVGSLSEPSIEQVVALEPDLVILGQDLSSHREARETLEGLGIRVFVADVDSFDDYAALMKCLTIATGRQDLYQSNVVAVSERIEAMLASSEFEGSYLAIRTSATKNKVLKTGYFACAMLDDFGLDNIADDTSAFDSLSLEAIAEADPDWIFVVLQGADDEAVAAYRVAFEQHPVWSGLTAVREGRVVILPKDLFQYKPNARWDEAYGYLAQVLSGGLA